MRDRSLPGLLGRVVYGGVGFVLLGIGIAGAVLPVLPSTIFLLGAAYCFARSIPALERRLLASRWLGSGLRRFRETRGMTRSAKKWALISMWISVGLSAAALATTGVAAPLGAVAAGMVGAYVIAWWIPTVDQEACEGAADASLPQSST